MTIPRRSIFRKEVIDRYIWEKEKSVLPKIASSLGIKMSVEILILMGQYETASLPLDT